ncbi:hypothetical protein D3C84_654910 [compost metagenome]
MLDALGHAHGRPQSLAAVVGAHGSVEGGQCGIGIEQRRAAKDHLLVAVGTGQVHRAADLGQWPVPGSQDAIDQVLTLFGLAVKAILFRDVGGAREQVLENIGCGHVVTPLDWVMH